MAERPCKRQKDEHQDDRKSRNNKRPGDNSIDYSKSSDVTKIRKPDDVANSPYKDDLNNAEPNPLANYRIPRKSDKLIKIENHEPEIKEEIIRTVDQTPTKRRHRSPSRNSSREIKHSRNYDRSESRRRRNDDDRNRHHHDHHERRSRERRHRSRSRSGSRRRSRSRSRGGDHYRRHHHRSHNHSRHRHHSRSSRNENRYRDSSSDDHKSKHHDRFRDYHESSSKHHVSRDRSDCDRSNDRDRHPYVDKTKYRESKYEVGKYEASKYDEPYIKTEWTKPSELDKPEKKVFKSTKYDEQCDKTERAKVNALDTPEHKVYNSQSKRKPAISDFKKSTNVLGKVIPKVQLDFEQIFNEVLKKGGQESTFNLDILSETNVKKELDSVFNFRAVASTAAEKETEIHEKVKLIAKRKIKTTKGMSEQQLVKPTTNITSKETKKSLKKSLKESLGASNLNVSVESKADSQSILESKEMNDHETYSTNVSVENILEVKETDNEVKNSMEPETGHKTNEKTGSEKVELKQKSKRKKRPRLSKAEPETDTNLNTTIEIGNPEPKLPNDKQVQEAQPVEIQQNITAEPKSILEDKEANLDITKLNPDNESEITEKPQVEEEESQVPKRMKLQLSPITPDQLLVEPPAKISPTSDISKILETEPKLSMDANQVMEKHPLDSEEIHDKSDGTFVEEMQTKFDPVIQLGNAVTDATDSTFAVTPKIETEAETEKIKPIKLRFKLRRQLKPGEVNTTPNIIAEIVRPESHEEKLNMPTSEKLKETQLTPKIETTEPTFDTNIPAMGSSVDTILIAEKEPTTDIQQSLPSPKLITECSSPQTSPITPVMSEETVIPIPGQNFDETLVWLMFNKPDLSLMASQSSPHYSLPPNSPTQPLPALNDKTLPTFPPHLLTIEKPIFTKRWHVIIDDIKKANSTNIAMDPTAVISPPNYFVFEPVSNPEPEILNKFRPEPLSLEKPIFTKRWHEVIDEIKLNNVDGILVKDFTNASPITVDTDDPITEVPLKSSPPIGKYVRKWDRKWNSGVWKNLGRKLFPDEKDETKVNYDDIIGNDFDDKVISKVLSLQPIIWD